MKDKTVISYKQMKFARIVETVMENALIFMLIFGISLILAAASLWFSKDPRKSPLLGRVSGIEKMGKTGARKIAREISGCVAAAGLAIVIYCAVSLLSI